MNLPLVVPMCVFFIFGIIAANFFNVPFLHLFILLILSLITSMFLIRKKILFLLFLSLTSFFLGACVLVNAKTLPANHIAGITPYKGKSVWLKGIIIDEPLQKKNKVVFTLFVKELQVQDTLEKVTGKVLVWCFKNEDFRYGREVILEGKLYRPYPLRLSKRFDYREYLKRKGIYSMLSVSKKGKVIFTGNDHGNPVKKFAFSLNNKVKQMISSHLSPEAAGVLSAMILGARSDVPQFFNKALQKTGTVHVLAVSGLHTGIIIFLALMLLRMTAIHYRIRYVLIIVMLGFFYLLTGNRVSVLRAAIMGSIFLFAEVINRDYDPLNALSLGALIILWINPVELFDPGFQLSFLSVLSIFLFYSRILESFPEKYKRMKISRFFVQGISVSLGAWIGTVGMVAYYFNIFTPASVLANLIVIPLLFLIILSALLFISLGMLISALAPILALNCEFFVVLMYKVNALIIGIPGAFILLPEIAPGYVFLYYGILLMICVRCRSAGAAYAQLMRN